MSDLTGDKRIRYGNWMPDRKAALGGLTLPGWIVLLFGILTFTFSITVGAWQFGLFVLGLSFVFVFVFILRWGDPYTGPTIAQRIAGAVSGSRRAERGEARFHTGLFSNLPAENLTPLPGVLGNIREIDGTDGRGEPYTFLYHPIGKTLTAVFACNPDGTQLQTQSRIDQDVSWYGGWIASLSADSAIAGAVVVVDSAMRSSAPLVRKIATDIDPDAPAIAKQATMEAAAALPSRYEELGTWVVLSWQVDALSGSLEDAVADVAAKLPYHSDMLRAAGGGSVTVATSEMLGAAVEVAHDPERSTEQASDELVGIYNPTRVTQAGPHDFDDSHKRVVLHDGNASMTALVMSPPKVHITEQTMAGLFRPASRFLRKRVAIFYRPVAPSQTARLVEQLDRTSATVATSKSRASGVDKQRIKQAEKLQQEVTEGAAMTRFGIAVTVTFERDARAYREAKLKLQDLLESSHLSYRYCDWDSGPAFYATMPLGLLPWNYDSAVQRFTETVS